ncbi:MAG: FKBP-type peptidyl-prolyl cis-trans isomerase, partial [Gallionella sp.]|nr:FKBP-type peptidyl-prolyl cis-trans isomerase [Gallionella sp.]
MMKRTLFLPLALLLTAGIFSITACSKQAATQKETGVVAELAKADTKLGEGTEATAGRNVTVHYTGWL